MQPGTKVAVSIIGGALGLSLLLCLVLVVRSRPKSKPPAPVLPTVRRETPVSRQPPPEERLDKIIDRENEALESSLLGITMGVIGWIACVSVAYFAVAILIIVVLARDVRARAPDQVPLWCLLFFFGGAFAVVFWLAARPPLRPQSFSDWADEPRRVPFDAP